MEIKVDYEQINKYMADKLIESSIGEALKDVIDKEIKNLTSSYNNPVEPVVKNHIRNAVSNFIGDEYREKIQGIVREKLTDEFVQDLIDRLWDKFIRDYRS